MTLLVTVLALALSLESCLVLVAFLALVLSLSVSTLRFATWTVVLLVRQRHLLLGLLVVSRVIELSLGKTLGG
jgi:hypothetical protein